MASTSERCESGVPGHRSVCSGNIPDHGSTFEADGTGRCLSVDEPLHCLGVAGALHRDGGRCGRDLVPVGGGEFQVSGRREFSSSRASLRVPGIGTIAGYRASSHASATWAGWRPGVRAIRADRSTTARFAARAVGGEARNGGCGRRLSRMWSWFDRAGEESPAQRAERSRAGRVRNSNRVPGLDSGF